MDIDIFTEILSYIGMICILVAFLLETRDILGSKDTRYLSLMAIGSGLLAIRALLIYEWAFLVLEIVWCLAAIMALIKTKR
tara:strand:- start:16030 stop:16272 length:243 start_codon:yes stop_codon:yes gene_type:complete